MELVVKLEPDAEGYTGRECPRCKKYFKFRGGTGLPGSPTCHCPYCNHVDSPNEFFTEDQIEYAQSVAVNKFSSALLASLKKVERRPDPRAFISIGIWPDADHSLFGEGAGGTGHLLGLHLAIHDLRRLRLLP